MLPSVLLKAAALVVLLAIGAAIGVSCIPERRQPVPPEPPTPTAVRPEAAPMRDIAGRERDPRRGVTPGALEAEVDTPGTTRNN